MLGGQLVKEDQPLSIKLNHSKPLHLNRKKLHLTTNQMKSIWKIWKMSRQPTAKERMQNHSRLGLAEVDLSSLKSNQRKNLAGNAINFTSLLTIPASWKGTRKRSARYYATPSTWIPMRKVVSLKDVERDSWNQSEHTFTEDGFAVMRMLIKIQKSLNWVKWFKTLKHMIRMGSP